MGRLPPFVLSTFAVAALLAAGCISGPDGQEPDGATQAPTFAPFTPPAPDFDFSSVIDPDHGGGAGHSVPSLHTDGHGLRLKGFAAIQDILPLGVRGSITSVDVWGDYAVVGGMEGGLAFAILDISDRSAPRAIGWAPSAADGWTARFSDDGDYVFYGCQMLTGLGYAPSAVIGTCEDPEQPHLPTENPAGVSVWDVSDKTSPRFVTFTAVGGSHNIFYQRIGGEDYVFTSSTAILHFDRDALELHVVAELPGVHDVTVARHPVSQDWLLFTGTGELAIYNVNDPASPEVVFEGAGDEGWTGWHDQVLVPALVGGKAILALSGESFCEVPVSNPVCGGGERLPDVVSIVDVTDPGAPVLLGQWQPPFDPTVPWASYLYSVHEMAATPQGQVAIAWYHGGVWVIDVSTPERQGGPVTLAAYQPHEELSAFPPSMFVQVPVPYVPFVWSAAWDAQGYLVVPDMHTGLYVLEPDWGLHPGLDTGQ